MSKGVWTPRADMPFAVQEIYPTVVTVAGVEMIMNAGGFGAEDSPEPVTAATTIYDPTIDSWRRGAPLPTPRHHIALAALQGAVYAIGGFSATSEDAAWIMRADVYRTDDPITGAWEAAPALPAPQAEAICVVVNNRIHMVGGRRVIAEKNADWSDHVDTDAHWAFDPATNKWTACAPLPTARNSAAAAVLNGEIFVVSGRTVANGNTPVCEAYNPEKDTWRTIAPLPKPVRQKAPHGQGGLAAAARNGKVYCFGGEWFDDDDGVYADAWEYDPAADAWRAVAAMPRPRHGLGAVNLADGIYALGGALGPSGDGTSAFVDRFSL
ncbi:MAG: galactose oxidase [Pseudomonadota bacterium]